MSIAILDISEFIKINDQIESKDDLLRLEIASKLIILSQKWNEAMTTLGVVLITGHNISPELIDEFDNEAKQFFNQTIEEKMIYNHSVIYGLPEGGYTPPGIESVARSNISESDITTIQPDPVENFVFCNEPKHFNSKCKKYSTPFKHSQQYYEQLILLLQILHKISSLALNLNDLDYFNHFYFSSNIHTNPNGNALRLSHYFPHALVSSHNTSSTSADVDVIQYGEHTDYQGFTILYPDPHDWDTDVHGTRGTVTVTQLYVNLINFYVFVSYFIRFTFV